VGSIKGQLDHKKAFTIIELLTVMSVIIILIGMLVPALNMVKRFARRVTQKNQFHAIEVGLETFNAEWDGYPPSGPRNEDGTGGLYCGAMKLCEALLGQDLLGFHPDARFAWPDPVYQNGELSARRKYLKPGSANANKLGDIYPETGAFPPDAYVISDVYTNHLTNLKTGKGAGMPVLYYRANQSGTIYPTSDNGISIDDPRNIYDYKDNIDLTGFDIPWKQPGSKHPMYLDPMLFYKNTLNPQMEFPQPYNPDSYILQSAGFDGEYGTDDDVFNFMRR